jgi:hypothetical protein
LSSSQARLDKSRLEDLRSSLKRVPGDSDQAVEIREKMGMITSHYQDHEEFLIPDWDEYCECETCESYGEED